MCHLGTAWHGDAEVDYYATLVEGDRAVIEVEGQCGEVVARQPEDPRLRGGEMVVLEFVNTARLENLSKAVGSSKMRIVDGLGLTIDIPDESPWLVLEGRVG